MKTKEQNLELIRQKCIEANPEIGRLPEYPYNPNAAKAIVAIEAIAAKRLYSEDIEQSASMMIENYRQQQAGDYRAMLEGRYEGRPIRLADVLLAIRFKHPPEIAEDYAGDAYDDGSATYERKAFGILRKWNLRKDDLNEQSEQTIDYLASLLHRRPESHH